MSGFVGIVNLDGGPVDRAVLDRMTKSLAFRGPDGQGMWSQGNAGLGHALLRVARESAQEAQPATLDGRVYCVAHARMDARQELAEKLRRAGIEADLAGNRNPAPAAPRACGFCPGPGLNKRCGLARTRGNSG